jgi:6-phosphogluconolactonase (cycloisomerase 2 family)
MKAIRLTVVVLVLAACSSNPTSSSGPPAATSLVLSGLTCCVTIGAPAAVTVSAKDASGHTVAAYTGTVNFSSSDVAAVLPANYTFLGADAGSRGFAVTFERVGSQTLTATDVRTSSIRGSATVSVTPTLFVANAQTFTVTGYAAGTNGNVAPALAIVGLNTNLDIPLGIARDTAGRIYVVNHGTNSILVYAPGDTGNATPVNTIMGANTGLDIPWGCALDGAGRLYVVNYNPNTSASSITVYAAGATGNATPIATIAGSNTGLRIPEGIALDAAGRFIYVTNSLTSISTSYHAITAFSASATGNAAPVDSIVGDKTALSTPVAIALDAGGRIYVANYGNNSVTVYATGATGNAAPIDSIGGSNTGLSLLSGIALDRVNQLLYVANYGGSITVYGMSATGNVAPVDTIVGSNTGLYGPSYITF